MFGRKFKFLCLGLSGCVFQFGGCSGEVVAEALRAFTPAFAAQYDDDVEPNFSCICGLAPR